MFFRPADPETGSQQLLTSLLGEEWPGLVEVHYVRRPCAGERARTPPPVYLTSPEDLRERWAGLARPNNLGFDVFFAYRDRPDMSRAGLDALPYLWVDIDQVPFDQEDQALCALLHIAPHHVLRKLA